MISLIFDWILKEPKRIAFLLLPVLGSVILVWGIYDWRAKTRALAVSQRDLAAARQALAKMAETRTAIDAALLERVKLDEVLASDGAVYERDIHDLSAQNDLFVGPVLEHSYNWLRARYAAED